ncbi:ExbD/TolR family protein [Treponema endosymbiont of Eucomonympha sp.]|uniref:ExbD/TolR family protein n=1 Tax=Treponema endosymbiont of Eucomonympha sp. TaxID=1580831 RepID=UPI000750EBAE|nr:biopolymer transporter ExbD [Treponema endosymbiont of Eucomonympha sp.]
MNLKRPRVRGSVLLHSTSDVAFLLLIFFMLVSLDNYRKEVKIEYPEAETAQRTGAAQNLEIWLDREGALYLDGTRCVLADIEAAVADRCVVAPDTRVHIIADKATPFEYVNGVLGILQLLERRAVSFVARDA